MSIGLLALLDDVIALVKVSAANLDGISQQVAKTSGKVSGIVIDDAAVTPKYVVGLDPSRELAIIYKITLRSLINKILFLAPAALLLGHFLPWAIQPLLMLGGAYLCLEGYEKVHSIFSNHGGHGTEAETPETITAQQLEDMRVKSAVQTDFILSAEIIAITYASVVEKELATQIIVLFCIAIAITLSVYGFVGVVVKADDVGLHMAKNSRYAFARSIGRSVVRGMPRFLQLLGYVGTAAMLWVGAEIIIHGIPPLHHGLEHLQETLAHMPALAWGIKALLCAIAGLAVGAAIATSMSVYATMRRRKS